MAGESINTASAWFQAKASEAIAGGSNSAAPSTPLSGSGLSANEQNYLLTDFHLAVSANAASENEVMDLYRIPGANGAGENISGTYLQQHVGSFVHDGGTGNFYIYGVDNVDPADAYMLRNTGGGSVTCVLNQRTRTAVPAA